MEFVVRRKAFSNLIVQEIRRRNVQLSLMIGKAMAADFSHEFLKNQEVSFIPTNKRFKWRKYSLRRILVFDFLSRKIDPLECSSACCSPVFFPYFYWKTFLHIVKCFSIKCTKKQRKHLPQEPSYFDIFYLER